MATLRSDLPLFREPEVSLADMENFRAQQMGDLRRGWVSTRIGTDANYALADLASARAQEDTARAEQLQARVDGLRQRQAMYTPRVSRLEQIEGPGDFVDWAQGMVGSGPASMLDPVAAAAAMTAAGTGLRMVPHPAARLVGLGLQTVGAFAVPYAINQRQLTGEFYGQAIEDPTIMENYTPQQLAMRANLQGARAAALDSVVPAIIGRGLGGAGLHAGLRGGALGTGARTVGTMGIDGGTEVAQGELTRQGLAQMNPERVDENVGMDRLNEFAAGFVGAGPFAAAGALADTGFRRVGATADQAAGLVREQAGRVVDMYDGSRVQDGVNATAEATQGLFRRGRDAVAGMVGRGKDAVVDMQSGKTTVEDITASFRERTQGVFDSMNQALEEREVLKGNTLRDITPDHPDYGNAMRSEEARRSTMIAEKLAAVAPNDPRAADLIARIDQPHLSPADRMTLEDEAADYLIEKSNIEQITQKAERASTTVGKAAAATGKVLGRVGSGLWGAAKSMFRGFNEGRRQNRQDWTEEQWQQEQLDRTEAGGRAQSLLRAQNFSDSLAEAVRARQERFTAVAPGSAERVAVYMGDVGFEIASLAEQWAPIMAARPTRDQSSIAQIDNDARLRDRQTRETDKSPTRLKNQGQPFTIPPAEGPNFEALTLSLNRIANDMNNAFGADAAQELAAIEGMAAPESEPFFRYLEEQLAVVQSRDGARATAAIRRDAQNTMLRALSPEVNQRLLKAGVNIHRPDGKRMLLSMVEAIYTGRASKEFDRELGKMLGQDVLDGMLQAIDTRTQQFAAEYVDDRAVDAGEAGLEISEDGDVVETGKRNENIIQKQGERAVAKSAGDTLYGFYRTGTPRTASRGDPFRTGDKVTADEIRQWEINVSERAAEGLEPDWESDPRNASRPPLIPEGKEDAAIRSMERRLKVDQTPARMKELLEQERDSAAASIRRMEGRPKAEQTPEVMGRLREQHKNAAAGAEAVGKRIAAAEAGDEASQAWLDDRLRPFFLARAGEWSVTAVPAADIMRERGMTQRAQVLAMYRDYMRKEGTAAQRSPDTAEQAQAAFNEARIASSALLDTLDQEKTRADGVKRRNRLDPEERRAVFARARTYFENHSVVVAQRLSDRDPATVSAKDLLELHEKGQRIVDSARKRAAQEEDGDTSAVSPLNSRGLLTFPSDIVGGKNKVVHVPAPALVYLARARRMMSEPLDFEHADENYSDKAKNEQYLRDLIDGISMVVASRHVTGMPVSYDKLGNPESFKQRIPKDLMLATNTYGNIDFGRQQRVNALLAQTRREAAEFESDGRKDARDSEEYQELVAREVTKGMTPPPERLPDAPGPAPTVRQGRGRITDKEDAARLKSLVENVEANAPLPLSHPQHYNVVAKAARGARYKNAKQEMLEFVAHLDEKYGAVEGIDPPQWQDNSWFVPDARQPQEPTGTQRVHALNPEEQAEYAELRSPAARQKYLATLRTKHGKAWSQLLDRVGPQGADHAVFADLSTQQRALAERADGSPAPYAPARTDNRTSVRPHVPAVETPEGKREMRRRGMDPQVHSDDVTPLDLVPPTAFDTEAGEALDEFAEQRRLSVMTGAVATGVKGMAYSKARMASEGVARGTALARLIREDTTAGLDELLNWMRLASRNGLHLAMPAAVALNRDTLASYPAAVQEEAAATRKLLAQIIRDDRAATPAVKVAVMRAMAPADQVRRITTITLPAMLAAVKGERQELGPMDADPTPTRRQIDAASTRAVQQYQQRFQQAAPATTPPAPRREGGAPEGKPQPASSPPPAGRGSAESPARSADVGRRLNAQGPTDSTPRPATAAEIKAAKDYIRKVLGPDIKVEFKDITGYSGEWIEAENTIEIAMTSAPGAMQVAYHESLHAFFSKFAENNPDVRRVLQALIVDPALVDRSKALLAKYPAALQQFDESAEERLAYIYQFWNAGLLELPNEAPKTLFQKLTRFFRRVAGMVTASERATAILEAFRDGKLVGEPSAVGQALAEIIDQGTWTTRKMRKIDNVVQTARSLVFPSQTILNLSPSPTAQKLAAILWTNPGEQEHGGVEEGYLNARMRHPRQYNNRLADLTAELTDLDLEAVVSVLQQEKDNLDDIAYKPQRDAAKKIRAMLQRFHRYMVNDSGVEIGDRGPFYFPRVWDMDALLARRGEFVDMLVTKYPHILQQGAESSKGSMSPEDVAERIANTIVNHSIDAEHIDPSREDGVLAPFFAQKEVRSLSWLDSADAEPFLEKNAVMMLTQYFHNGSRSAEYVRRFGNKGERLQQMLDTINDELIAESKAMLTRKEIATAEEARAWVTRQMDQIHTTVGAVEGTLGKDISNTWRQATAWATVYQNIRLLPLILFSSVIDPLGVIARGGSVSQAYDTFLYGVKEVVNNWKRMMQKNGTPVTKDKWERLAQDVGAAEAAMFGRFMSDAYASAYMGKTAKNVNDTFFQLNGMEGWNRGVRVGATKAAVAYLQYHKGLPELHSERWLKELGLTADDIYLDSQGDLITDWRTLQRHTGMTPEQAQKHIGKIHYGITRWTEGAIITPNAAQRPGWASDPRTSIFFHLKQFMYSFHMTILKRAVGELQEGNLRPIAAFLWYVPVMIGSDLIKGLIQGAGELPMHMQGMTAGDWILHGVERSGVLGIGQIGVDANQDLFSLAGPMVEQITDSFSQELGQTGLRALPGHPLYRDWVQ